MLPYDLVYYIYFFVDDYCTANKFWILSKTFNTQYMEKFNKSYKYKFNILYKDLFTFLQCLSAYQFKPYDLLFYECVSTQCLNKKDRLMMSKDIRFIYNLYNKHFIKILLFVGPEYLDKIIDVNFNKNKISLKIKNFTPFLDLLDM